MRKVCFGLAVLCSVAAIAAAAETAQPAPTVESVQPVDTSNFATIDLSYTSEYIWRGFDLLDDGGAFQPSANFDLGGGFSANLWMSYADCHGETHDEATEYDYTLAYSGTVYEDCPWKTDYMVGWRYYDYIKQNSKDGDMQEVFATAEMPRLFDGTIIPHAAVFQMWSAKSGSDVAVRDAGGTIYLMGFNYPFVLDPMPSLPLTFSWDIVYNDGTGNADVDHDWSHMVWGLSTKMTCPLTGAKIVPAIYFQNSFEDSVNNEDELWGAISYSFGF
jgi:hypothetical protein